MAALSSQVQLNPPLELEGLLSTLGSPQPQAAAKLLGEDLLVAMVCSPQQADGGPEFELLAQAAKEASIQLESVVWSDPEVHWQAYDALLPLRVWDYTMRASSFRHWLSERETEGSVLINSAALIRWNLDKGYLIELQELGVSMPKTELRLAGSRNPGSWPAHTSLVAKPRLGAGGVGIELLPSAGWQPPARDLLVQRYRPLINSCGEISLLMVEGQPCGQVRRHSSDDDFRVGATWGGSSHPEPVDPLAAELSCQVIKQLPETPLYARVDIWDFEQPYLLAEVELVEPELFLGLIDGAAELIAEHLRNRLLRSKA